MCSIETPVKSVYYDGKAEEYWSSRSRNMIVKRISRIAATFNEILSQDFKSNHP